ncbi:alpha/beta hydrolase [Ideonella livida]|uniref:Alpha/beta hydrolase n=1 Tax=Ideonella livida TaxID=2707176 RepID=A0A7C9TIM8_9BURK|nr:alpha/beta hydrolase [Ideonella livida]NDY90522.1 alpha/beta hydrolase [Ideonella livida]
MRGVLDRIARARRPAFHTLPVAQARAAYTAAAEILDLPRAPLPTVQTLALALPHGQTRPARLYRPRAEGELPVLLYLHGGGFVIGNLETHDSLCRQLAQRSGAAVLALDYRLAPEHRFPAAVEDAWAALRWLQEGGAETLDLDPQRMAVGGDSAGGTLAAASALWCRDQGLPLALQLLITPGTIAHADTPSHHLFAHGFLLDRESISWFFDQYIDRSARADWRFAPALADVDGVAPACVVLAECDPLVDEGLAYADQLRAAGVPVSLELYRGVTHDFIKMGRALREASTAMDAIAQQLREALCP